LILAQDIRLWFYKKPAILLSLSITTLISSFLALCSNVHLILKDSILHTAE